MDQSIQAEVDFLQGAINVSVPVVVLVCCVLFYGLFLVWYGGWGSPMSSTEIEGSGTGAAERRGCQGAFRS